MERKKASVIKIFFGTATAALMFFIFAQSAFAASLYLSPATGKYNVGQSFTVNVYVSSVDQAMNAAQGTIIFPSNKLQVISVSTANSIVTLWVQPPSFSNRDGVVNFQGVVVNPGFEGARGKIITVTFLVKAAGSANMALSQGSVLANDGKGTNILTSLAPAANFTLASEAPPSLPPQTSTSSDTIPPEAFMIKQISGITDPTDPRPIFTWNDSNASSVIDKYLVKIGGGDWINATEIEMATSTPDLYQLPLQAPGNNVQLIVDAYTQAEAMMEASTTFSVTAIPTPEVTSYSHLLSGSSPTFEVAGRTINNGRVRGYLQKAGDSTLIAFGARANASGTWTVSQSVNIDPGSWVMNVRTIDDRGAISVESQGYPVTVGSWYTDLAAFLLGWGGVAFLALALILLIAALLYVLNHRVTAWRLELDHELLKMREELHGDLKRVDEELADVNPGNIERRQQNVRSEIDHIQRDLKKDIEVIDDVEKSV